jgi:alkylhydroperoxidase family enzyme/thiol-disulfide isomerase/thioredoxin
MGIVRYVRRYSCLFIGTMVFSWSVLGTLGPNVATGQNSDVSSSSSQASSWNAWERVSDDQAWAMLPALASGEKQPLPNWIKPVVIQMPRTAAAMLELDKAFRDSGPLDAALRAKLRWTVAHANHCEYGEKLALADLQRVSGGKANLSELTNSSKNWPTELADEVEFVRLLTVAGPTIPDALFERLRVKHGDRGVAAMVLLTAYGNFQDRLLLGLNVPVEKNGPYPPLDVKFGEGALQMTPLIPPDNGVATYEENGQAVTPRDQAWKTVTYDQLQQKLEKQRDRKPRLPIPTWDEVKGKLPDAMAVRPTSIRWSLINYGYAAELAIPWTLTTRTHWAECPSNRIFEESLFWVQTRAVGCNYCMGHCEMLLEVAGLDKEAVAKRTRLLADTDWASFPATEQRAYAYARKLSLTPKDLSANDYQLLEQDLDPKQAMSVFLWLCRGLYMTRISDGFQLPLERENVFGPPAAETQANEEMAPEVETLTPEAAAIADELRRTLDKDSEAIAMLNDILKGSNLGPEDGWFPLAKVENRFGWEYVLKRYDTNADASISTEEFQGHEEDFGRLDRDDDGAVTADDFDWSEHSLTPSPGLMMFFMADSDANGKVTKDEFLGLYEQFVAGGDYLAIDDLRSALSQSNSGQRSKRADTPTPSTLVKGLKNQELGSLQPGPRLDELAPDFTLTALDGKKVTLSKVTHEKPTVLIFGNFTCGPFRSQAGNVEKLYERYKQRANFYLIYVREAHPSDGWWMQSNQRAGIDLSQPKDNSQRRTVAQTCQKHLKLDIPFLVDTVDDHVGSVYSGMPNRLYLIDQQGRIAFKNGRGPFGFHPRQLEQALVVLLNESAASAADSK